MSLVEINWKPTKTELRKFGLIAIVFLGAVACLFRFVFSAPLLASIIIASIGVTIFIVSIVSAKLTRLIYLGLTFAGLPIGLVVSVTLMAIFYFLILTPVGLFFKLIGRDLMQRKFQPGSQTYWSKRKNTTDPERYFHQF